MIPLEPPLDTGCLRALDTPSSRPQALRGLWTSEITRFRHRCRWATNRRMFRRATLALFGLLLAACATTSPRANTHSLLKRVDSDFFFQAQCQPTGTASLSG